MRAFLAVFLLLATFCFAHTDPAGDVHPGIVVEGDRFVIYFSNNQERSDAPNLYETVISVDGKVLKNRIKTKNQKGRDNRWIWEPRAHGALILRESGKELRVAPKWKRDIEYIKDIVWSDTNVWALLSYPRKTSPYEPYPFYLATIDRATGAVSVSASIGNPSRIYHFPVASALTQVGNYLYLVWAREVPAGKMDVPAGAGEAVEMDTVQPELILSRFDTRSNEVANARIEELASTNISIDIAAVHSKLLVAHHANGKINWQIIDLANQHFQPKPSDEPGGADQPATVPESKSEGKEKLQPASEGRPK